MESANKWNQGFRYEHLFDVGFSVATDKPWEDVTAEELLDALERRLACLRTTKGEILEATTCFETIEYDTEA